MTTWDIAFSLQVVAAQGHQDLQCPLKPPLGTVNSVLGYS